MNNPITLTPNNDAQTVGDLRALLGPEAILLPVAWGTKIPRLKGWQTHTHAIMEDPAYLASLEGSNIGVLLGEASQGICTIDIDDDQAAVDFERLNPHLSATLQTRGARGCNYWLKIIGSFPKAAMLSTTDGTAWGEFRANGNQTIIFGRHPDGMDYEILEKAHPMEIAFDEIVWPAELGRLPWDEDPYDTLVAKEGPPLAKSEKGAFTINPPAWAEKFLMENILMFEPDEQEFYQYNAATGLYDQVSAHQLGESISRDIKRVSGSLKDESLNFKRNPGMLRSISDLMKGKLEGKGRNAFAKTSTRIHVKNGVIEVSADKATWLDFHSDYVSRTAIPLEFDPNAECPRFYNEFLRPCLPEEDIDVLQLYFGTMLLGRNLSQRIVLLKGAAGSGKSTLMNVVEAMVGRDNVSELRMKHLDSRFELYGARRALLLVGKDVRSDYLESPNASFLKKLSGRDQIDMEKKGGDRFSIMGDFHIVITSNARLQVRLDGDFDAWQRRLVLIEFNNPGKHRVIPEFDKVLLHEEGSGILNFFFEGASRYLEILAKGENLELSDTQSARVRDILLESNSVDAFIREAVERCPGNEIASTTLYAEYLTFCDLRDWEAKPQNTFAHGAAPLLWELYGVKKRHDIHGTVRGYRGIRVNNGGLE